ncbi:hypothetical protein ACS0TY_024889 [Phlomoides rotata]
MIPLISSRRPETDPATVRKIREAINNQKEVTIQLINYTKTGKKFWNLFHLQPMRDQKVCCMRSRYISDLYDIVVCCLWICHRN